MNISPEAKKIVEGSLVKVSQNKREAAGGFLFRGIGGPNEAVLGRNPRMIMTTAKVLSDTHATLNLNTGLQTSNLAFEVKYESHDDDGNPIFGTLSPDFTVGGASPAGIFVVAPHRTKDGYVSKKGPHHNPPKPFEFTVLANVMTMEEESFSVMPLTKSEISPAEAEKVFTIDSKGKWLSGKLVSASNDETTFVCDIAGTLVPGYPIVDYEGNVLAMVTHAIKVSAGSIFGLGNSLFVAACVKNGMPREEKLTFNLPGFKVINTASSGFRPGQRQIS